MLKKWMPWTFIIQKAAKRYGFVDPAAILARLRRFGHPSEVQEPIELLRAGVLFHARGLINTRAIQYNLDWIWPFWVVKQFTPKDASFIPRGFSFSHVNLTHRNWTAVGIPGEDHYPIVDPRGLVTPHLDGWSIDVWVVTQSGKTLFPSREPQVEQSLSLTPALQVDTAMNRKGVSLCSKVSVRFNEKKRLIMTLDVCGEIHDEAGWVVLSVRPYNPEGIQFIDHIQYEASEKRLWVNQEQPMRFESSPEKVLFSNYECGDVAQDLGRQEHDTQVACSIGMATAALFFPLQPNNKERFRTQVPLGEDVADGKTPSNLSVPPRTRADGQMAVDTARLDIPDKRFSFLYDAAVQTLLLLSGKEVYPGPYTYKRFWFRDACYILNALLGIGLSDRCLRMMETFVDRQKMTGYFQSQEGEWDSNGQVLWLVGRYHELTGNVLDSRMMSAMMKGARWIVKKRRKKGDSQRHDGLLPAGFSAEHLGPNDYYYWDNFWGIAGLESAAKLAGAIQDKKQEMAFSHHAKAYKKRVFDTIMGAPGQLRYNAIPASCYRRMDAGAIGSLVADYPLQLTAPGDPLIMNTIDYLMDHCFYGDGFFQDMIHSGINAYLTLEIAQTLLRGHDDRYRRLIRQIADLATPTGQWPEAINPLTGGGCMGDGQHAWAAAEWILMMRNLFVREEGDTLILGSGIFPEWLEEAGDLGFGPTLIPGGTLMVRFVKSDDDLILNLDCQHHGDPMDCIVRVPGYEIEQIKTTVKQRRLTKCDIL